MEPMILGIPAGVFVVLSVVVPTWLVYLGFESHILHLRNRWAYWVVGISLMVFAVLVRGDLAEFAHPCSARSWPRPLCCSEGGRWRGASLCRRSVWP